MERAAPGRPHDRAADGGLQAVSAALERAAELAVSPTPEALDRTARLLESAVAELRAARNTHEGGAADGARGPEAVRMRRAVHRLRALLGKANEYHAGWSGYLGCRIGGYRADGAPVPLPSASRLSIRG